jgi:hypothetical protein
VWVGKHESMGKGTLVSGRIEEVVGVGDEGEGAEAREELMGCIISGGILWGIYVCGCAFWREIYDPRCLASCWLLLVSNLTLVFGYFGVVFRAGTSSIARTCSVCIGVVAAASKGSKLQRIQTNTPFSPLSKKI